MNYDFTTKDGREITCELEIDISNDGIGPYEFWGEKCYDVGNKQVEWKLKAVYTENEKFIKGLFFDEIENELQSFDERIQEQALMEDIYEN